MFLLNPGVFPEADPGQPEPPARHFDRSLHHDVYAVIVDWIHQGMLKPGQRVSEAAIARHLGISRGPVREAIGRLDFEGLLIRRPRRGAIVTEFTAKDLEEIASVRQLIEGHAARLACEQITPHDLSVLEKLVTEMQAAAEQEQWTETAVLNGRFHQSVVQIASNKILSKMWQTLHPLAWLLAPVASTTHPHDPASMAVRHRFLLDALQSGDPDRAEEAFRHHVARSTQSTIDRWKAARSDPPVTPEADHRRPAS